MRPAKLLWAISVGRFPLGFFFFFPQRHLPQTTVLPDRKSFICAICTGKRITLRN